ncbi:hypothetical protein NC651_017826 [Populus alba x Populus x berolinensis]|nr:hypothetical protein NC651_017826 [Populus alba x Populus x berolinensis]
MPWRVVFPNTLSKPMKPLDPRNRLACTLVHLLIIASPHSFVFLISCLSSVLPLSLSAPPLYSLQNPKPPQMTISIKRGEKRCCLDLTFALPCLAWNLPARPGKKGVSGFVGSRLKNLKCLSSVPLQLEMEVDWSLEAMISTASKCYH